MDARKPATVIAMLPAYDLLGLCGSFSLPRRLPTTSAIPGSAWNKISKPDGKWMNELSYEQIAQNFAFVKEKGIIMISQSFQSLNKRTSKGSIEPAADIWIPSPAHKLQISAIATGEVLHNTAVAKVIVVA
jgi:hypothetical protein